jgi:murein DD-endopeptidase MepM/ murein hydrolase activator NlpD
MVGVRGTAVGLCTLLMLVSQAGGETRSAPAPPRSQAYGVKILLPNSEPIVAGAVTGPPSTYDSAGAFSYPEDGSIVRVGTMTGRAVAAVGTRATAGSDLRKVELFDGDVTADAVVARSSSLSAAGSSESKYGATQITNLVVLGQQVEPAPDLRIALGDWGHLTLLEERERTNGRLHRGWVTVLDVRLDADHAGLPIGTRILVGYAAAASSLHRRIGRPVTVTDPAPAETPSSLPSGPAPRPRISRGIGDGAIRPGTGGPPAFVLAPTKIAKRLTAGGYVFPVYGPVAFSDTFGAPRADTIWHHGDDIFAPLGAPVLAVADGTVYSVGANRLGGNRFWLRDLAGNEFYYAHLSAFAPAAINGARVSAGDVIGFVGNTGDAEYTPYHLHFEIHPASMLVQGEDGVIDPTPYLEAWQHLTDIAFPTAAIWAPTVIATGNAPAAGAILLQSSDISTASGLDPGSLIRALAPPSLGGEGVWIVDRVAREASARRASR